MFFFKLFFYCYLLLLFFQVYTFIHNFHFVEIYKIKGYEEVFCIY